jgi:hypothetical protein
VYEVFLWLKGVSKIYGFISVTFRIEEKLKAEADEVLNEINLNRRLGKNIDVISRAVEADFGTGTADWIFTADIYPVLIHASHVKKP